MIWKWHKCICNKPNTYVYCSQINQKSSNYSISYKSVINQQLNYLNYHIEKYIYCFNKLTLNEYSNLTKKGKLIDCKIFFSFSVCSTCFNLTTWENNTSEFWKQKRNKTINKLNDRQKWRDHKSQVNLFISLPLYKCITSYFRVNFILLILIEFFLHCCLKIQLIILFQTLLRYTNAYKKKQMSLTHFNKKDARVC